MTQEYIIVDNTCLYENARNPLEQRLIYAGDTWVKKFSNALKYKDLVTAQTAAATLNKELPVKLLVLQTEGNQIGVGEVSF